MTIWDFLDQNIDSIGFWSAIIILFIVAIKEKLTFTKYIV